MKRSRNVPILIALTVIALCPVVLAQTDLMIAAEKGDTKAVQALLAKGADVNAKRADGYTSLMFAAGSGSTETVQALLAQGADVDAKRADGYTALMFAEAAGDTAIVQLLKNANK